jgi:hypothetical protein
MAEDVVGWLERYQLLVQTEKRVQQRAHILNNQLFMPASAVEAIMFAELCQLQGDHPWLQQQGCWASNQDLGSERKALFETIGSVKGTVLELSQQVCMYPSITWRVGWQAQLPLEPILCVIFPCAVRGHAAWACLCEATC